jgi:rhodanese-related sulfurtransferase
MEIPPEAPDENNNKEFTTYPFREAPDNRRLSMAELISEPTKEKADPIQNDAESQAIARSPDNASTITSGNTTTPTPITGHADPVISSHPAKSHTPTDTPAPIETSSPIGSPVATPSIGRPNYIPFVVIILLLILSNIMFAMEYFEDDDDDEGEDTGDNGNTTQPREQIIGEFTVFQSYEFIQNNTNNSRFVLIDVRAASDFNAERIHGAINIDYFDESYDDYVRILDRNLTYLLYCDGGGISSLVQDDMEALGYLEVYHMLNGIDRWKELGYETEGGDS